MAANRRPRKGRPDWRNDDSAAGAVSFARATNVCSLARSRRSDLAEPSQPLQATALQLNCGDRREIELPRGRSNWAHSPICMKVRINSDEFRAWHEVGHASVCLHFGGYVDAIEFLEGDTRGFAVARGCAVTPDKERHVACGGFAAEYHLLKSGYLEDIDLSDRDAVDKVSSVVFANAWQDRLAFARRVVTPDNDFSKQEDEDFMWYAIEHVAPIIDQHFERMKLLVKELLILRRVNGHRVKELLQIDYPS